MASITQLALVSGTNIRKINIIFFFHICKMALQIILSLIIHVLWFQDVIYGKMIVPSRFVWLRTFFYVNKNNYLINNNFPTHWFVFLSLIHCYST